MNEQIKEEYLKTKQFANNVRALFKRMESIEEDNNKDLCMFNIIEITEAYKKLDMKSFEMLSNFHSQLLAYSEWCLKNGKRKYKELDGCKINNYSAIHSYDLHAIMNDKETERIISREQLLDMAKELPNPSDAFILLCLFEGIKGNDYSEIREIKWDDFKGNILKIVPGRIKELHGSIIPSPRDIEVSDELILYANKSRFTSIYHPLTDGDGQVVYDSDIITELSEENFIVRRTEKARKASKQPKLTRRIVAILAYTQHPELSSTDIRNSGKVYYTKKECERENISAEDFVLKGDNFSRINERFNDQTQRQTFWNKYHSLF